MRFKKDNKGIVLTVTNKRKSGSIIDLTGRTVKMQIKDLATEAVTSEVTGTVTDATGGICTYTLDTLLANAAGDYDGEFQLSQGATYLEDSFTFSFGIDTVVKV